MDFLQFPLTENLSFKPIDVYYSPKFNHKFSFNAELCGIWLGELPFNQHLDATLLPAHMLRTPQGTPRIPIYTPRPLRNDSTKTELPQRSSKKTSTTFGFGSKLLSSDTLIKSDSFDFNDEFARRLESASRLQMEACKISGSITCANACLIFRSREPDLKIPTHLGGPGDQDLLSPNSQHSLDYGFPLNCDHLNSGTILDLSYWTIENETNFSCQSLLSSQSGCFPGGRKVWSSVNSPANLRKRSLKQFWTSLLSKKLKQK
ncbi:unnamed protein product [Rodentolepis nana]|uniref:Uncharacterized protein n=1 Tax=Rodentolepis nana TaxID=102285 RepID=A0A0R3TPJ0_RODNA|nr:unnamed protein product [Rodentolepis nana]